MAANPISDRLVVTTRSALRRKRDRGSHERELINAVLDEALVCHVGFGSGQGPVVLPMTYVRIDNHLYLHGAAGNDMLRQLIDGSSELCVTVTLLDGLVFARSAFHHSMNYRSVVLFGTAERVTDRTEMRAVAAALVDHLAPGRSADARPPTDDELRSTLMVRLRITEGSVKVRTGGPIEEPDDLQLKIWAGELPIGLGAQRPVTDGQAAALVPVPSYITDHRLRPSPRS